MLEWRGDPGFSAASPTPADARDRPSDRLEPLLRDKVLPHLLRAHAHAAAPGLPCEAFARALLAEGPEDARQALARLQRSGAEPRRLLDEVLAPAARRLGRWWEDDTCDFFVVSEAMARLHALACGLVEPEAAGPRGPRLLLLTAPGETHLFGACLAADLFRREGWRVERADGDLRRARPGAFDAIGVSCGCEKAAAGLPQFLQRLKLQIAARPVPILLGGALFLGQPERAKNLGVDFVASEPDSPRRISLALIQPHAV